MVEPSIPMLSPNKENNEKNVHFTRVFRPIYLFARICGFMPFSVQHSETECEHFVPHIGICDAVWFAISMCFYLAMIVNTFCGKIVLPHESNAQLNAIVLGNHLLRLMILLFSIFSLIMDVCNRYKLVNIFNDFSTFDQEVSCKLFKFVRKSKLCDFFPRIRRWSVLVLFISTKHSIKRRLVVHTFIALE